jgi:hypothetical protein
MILKILKGNIQTTNDAGRKVPFSTAEIDDVILVSLLLKIIGGQDGK